MRWPYPAPDDQFSAWGPVTSTVNFCEQDYYVSPYIAEFINTISNVLFLLLAGYGMARSPTRDAVVLWSYALVGAVGLGSTLFHGSLKFATQMMDELGMVYAVSTVLYSLCTIDVRRPAQARALAGILVAAMAALTAVHCHAATPTVQRLVFTLMIYGTGARCVAVMRRVSDTRVRGEMKRIALLGTATYILGTALWAVDELGCGQLRALRARVGMPLGFVLELHGWWHILTAVGVYCYLVFVEYLRLVLLSAVPVRRMRAVWTLGVVPHLEVVPPVAEERAEKEQ